MSKLLSFVFLMAHIISCSTSPTGRKQLKLIPSQQMNTMGNQSFTSLKQSMTTSKNVAYRRRIRCITDRLLTAMGEPPSSWSIEVFENKEPNAFALPGNNMGIHTGMIELTENSDQIAAVIGHEIAHVLANHGNERVSQSAVIQMGLSASQLYLGKGGQSDQLILAGLGLGAKFGILLPFSRTHESEADALGMKYMAKAGFDPRQASALWRLMKKKSGVSGPEFISTHPSSETRIKKLESLAPKYIQDFEKTKAKTDC